MGLQESTNHSSLHLSSLGTYPGGGRESAKATVRLMRTDGGVAVVLIGDSDIERWPKSLYPSADIYHCCAVSGATLYECISLVQDAVKQGLDSESSSVHVVACTGENDVAQSISLEDSCNALKSFIEVVFSSEQDRLHLMFLGPKLEPWLNDDKESRRDYIRMSRGFEKVCTEHSLSERISFIECLVMFCGKSAEQRGALLGGKAKAEKTYFDYDLLHLNQKGYEIWKQRVDGHIKRS
eukprot:scaffold2804_cov181-Amphora_coffeaeformis.AAC.30